MSSSWVVMKFGGTSVSTVERWETIAGQWDSVIASGRKPFLVCSALSQVSNELEEVLRLAPSGKADGVLEAIEQKHMALCAGLGVSWEEAGVPFMDELRRMVLGVSLVKEVSPRIHARVMATGELLSTRIAHHYLIAGGKQVEWIDARTILRAHSSGHGAARDYLNASCGYQVDPILQEQIAPLEGVVTQGFIASNESGDTVLLGRGGSDTSASYFAAKIEADVCEIWTDVPGLYSANPRLIPDAHLLLKMGYDEAQELASAGAKVLHPRCIAPVRDRDVPLQVRSTQQPKHPGTRIDRIGADSRGQVRAISMKTGITLVSMETLGMWQQVGFLADAFQVFKRNGLSIDLISTSETNVTVSLDIASNAASEGALERVIEELAPICQARTIGPCASVSLVGRHIRGILHRLGNALELFEEHKVHLVSQASNDLNLTFVVEESQANRLIVSLHSRLFESHAASKELGPTWVSSHWNRGEEPWWSKRREQLLEVGKREGAAFVYDPVTLRNSAKSLTSLSAVDKIHYSIKANSHPDILRLFHEEGIGFECVSPGEVNRVLDVHPNLDPQRILFTPNFASREEYAFGFEKGVRVTVDSDYPLEHWGDIFEGQSFFIRLDPGQGRGHHEHVRTAGDQSKFGIEPAAFERVAARIRELNATVSGFHSHAGSGILTPEGWGETAVFQARAAEAFPDVRVLNLGGGLGIVEKPGQSALDLNGVNASLLQFKEAHPDFQIWLEPGRFLVGSAGVLVAEVTQVKTKGDVNYVGLKTGMNSLIRPALYGAYHEIVNLSRLEDSPSWVAHVVGPICETGDTLGYSRPLAKPEEGDILLIGTTGAYGRAMSSHYNLREPATEVLLP